MGWLENRDDDALANGANLAVLGNELLQFGRATPLGGTRYRLSRLLRGRRGSEWAMAGHTAADKFVLLDPNALRPVELPPATVGNPISVKASGLADDQAAPAQIQVTGEGLRPPCPVHLRASRTAPGDVNATWVRRSRSGWAWLDGLDAPLGESAERYRIRVVGPGGTIVLETTTAEAVIPDAQLALLGAGPLNLSVVQVGDYAESRPAMTIVN